MVGTLNITDMYMMVLTSLNNNDKLDLISKLSKSMRNENVLKQARPNLRTCFRGDWNGVEANELRDHTYHGRTFENW